MSGMGSDNSNKSQNGPFAHDAKELAALDYVIANFDSLAVLPEPGHVNSVPLVKAGTELIIDGVSKRLQLHVYRFNNPDGSYRYVLDAKKLLGAGANATVNQWIDAVTGEPLAAKVIKNPETIQDTIKEASRFNSVYEKLHGGKYRSAGKVFYTSNPKKPNPKDEDDDIERPDLLVFVMPMFPGKTLDKIAEKQENKNENQPKLSLIEEPKYKDKPPRGQHGDDDVILTGDSFAYEMFGYNQILSLEAEFKTRQDEVAREIKSGRLNFPGDMRRVEISDHIEKFRTRFTTKEQLDAEVKKNLERFIMRDAEVLPEMTPLENVSVGYNGKQLKRIDQIDFDENFELLLLVFKNMIEAVSVAHEEGIFISDLKLENFLFDDEGKVYLIDLGEAVDALNPDPNITKEFILRGTIPYATPSNLLALMNNRLHYPEAEKARKLLALKQLYEDNHWEVPSDLAVLDKNQLERTARAWHYTYNAENDSYALGCCGEMMCGLLVPAIEAVYNNTAGFGMPASIYTTDDDPRAAKINQFLKITKGLRGQSTPQISLNQAVDAIDDLRTQHQESMRLKPQASPAEHQVPKEKKVTFEPKAEEYLIPTDEPVESTSTKNADTRIIEPVTPNPATTLRERRFGRGLRNVFTRHTRVIKGLTPGEIRDIREAFKALDKSTVTKSSFIAKGTLFEDGATKIVCPCDCYRLDNGVIIAKINADTEIGEGAYGSVYEGVDIKSGDLYAIKILKREGENKYVDFDSRNEKIQTGIGLMSGVEVERSPQHKGMFHTINVGGFKVAFMPHLGERTAADLIKTHMAGIKQRSQGPTKPNIDHKARSPSDFSLNTNEKIELERLAHEAKKLGSLKFSNAEIEEINSIEYYRDELRKKSDLNDPLTSIVDILAADGFLIKVKDNQPKEANQVAIKTKTRRNPANPYKKVASKQDDTKKTIDKKYENVEVVKEAVDAYLPDSIIAKEEQNYAKKREVSVTVDDPEVFLKKLLEITEDFKGACIDNVALLKRGFVHRDIKPHNMIKNKHGLTTIDYDEAENLKGGHIYGKDNAVKGTYDYLSPYNRKLSDHLTVNKKSINAARQALTIYELLKERNELTPDHTKEGSLFSQRNLELLRKLASPAGPVWNSQSDAYALGVSAEEYSQLLFNVALFDKESGGMPNKLISATNDPCIAMFNKFLEITKKLLNPDVLVTYDSADALRELEIFSQRAKALQDVQQQLQHPQATSLASRVASRVQPFLQTGATVKTTTDMTRQSPAWDNAIQTLAVELDPRKHQVEVKADKSVSIKSKNTKKSVGSLALVDGTVYGNTSDADAFEQMLKVYIASHKPGEQVHIEIVGLADAPELAFRFQEIATNLKVDAPFDAETEAEVTKWQQQKKSTEFEM
jgi:serine/threonine protein kinase